MVAYLSLNRLDSLVVNVQSAHLFQVAVPLSPSSSSVNQRSEGGISSNSFSSSKVSNNSVKTTLSVIELGISREYLLRRSFSDDDIDLHHVIIDFQEGTNDNRVEKLNFKLNRISKDKLQKINSITWYRDLNATCQLLKKLSNNLTNDESDEKCIYPLERKIYTVNSESVSSSPFKLQDDDARKDVIKTWLQEVNLKSHDFLGRPVKKEQVLTNLINKLKNINFSDTRKNVRAKIVDVLDDLPISFFRTNRRTYLNRLANMLLTRLQRINFGNCSSSINRYKYVNLSQSGMRIFTSGIQPTEDELKVLVREELMDCVEKNNLEYNLTRIGYIETDIVDILLDLMNDIRSDRDGNAKEEITNILREAGMFTAQSEELANRILEQLKEMFNVVDETHIIEKPQLKTESIIMYQNDCHACKETSLDNESQTSDEDNLKFYTLQISHAIGEWLNDLGCCSPTFSDKCNKQAIIDDLAEDVVDRFKYLELNPPKHYFYDDLEHLKYQIFKWMSKLTGEDNLATLQTAPDLMRRIKNIPLPFVKSVDLHNFKYTNQDHEEATKTDSLLVICDRSCSTESLKEPYHHCFPIPESATSGNIKPFIMNTPTRVSQLSMFAPTKSSKAAETEQNDTIIKASVVNETVEYGNPAGISSVYVSLKEQDNLQVPNALTTPSKSINELNEEYDTFVKNWSRQIPIPSSTPEEKKFAETLRLGIYNGVWKLVAKLKTHPSNIFNPFHYQDLLDDELEALFNLLPQTGELQAKKHYLKVQFIEKTVNINDQIKMSFAPDTFKQNLVRNVFTYIPRKRTNTDYEDPVKLYEELDILQLAEIYILYARFKDEDQLKANVFRTKLVKRLQEFVEVLKMIHQKELQQIDRDLYINELLSAMQQVPLPSADTIKVEADEILLGMEIEQWMGDLPLVSIENTRELFVRRRLKDILAKKVHDLENSVNISDSDGDRLLRMEVSAFLGKLPLVKDQSLNLNFMVEELTNRIKNMAKYNVKNVGLDASGSLSYADFSKQVPGASSYIQMPVSKNNMNGKISSSMYPGNQVPTSCPQFCHEGNKQAMPSGINTQSIPMASLFTDTSTNTQSSPGQAPGYQRDGNIYLTKENIAYGPQGPSVAPDSTLRSQQAQTPGFNSMEMSAIRPVQYFQPIPLQQQLPVSTTADTSKPFGPRLVASVQNPPGYTSFEQPKPASSSFCPGHETTQSSVQPSGFSQRGYSQIGANQTGSSQSQSLAGHPNIIFGQPSILNQSNQVTPDTADFVSLPMDTHPQQLSSSVNQTGPIVGQPSQADKPNVINQSSRVISSQQGGPTHVELPSSSGTPIYSQRGCPSQMGAPCSSEPKFYRSTDPQGIMQFAKRNKKMQLQKEDPQQDSQEKAKPLKLTQDCCSQGSSVCTVPMQDNSSSTGPVSSSTPRGSKDQASSSGILPFVKSSKPPCPGESCPALKRAMETQCSQKNCFYDSDDSDPEELKIRCKCLERFTKFRSLGRFQCANPMYRFYAPCFCCPDMG